MAPPELPGLTRRRFLVAGGFAAGAVALGACGGGDDDDTMTGDGDTDGSSTTKAAGPPKGLALAQFFGGPLFVAGKPLRAPFGVVDKDGLLPVEDTPTELEVVLLDPDGEAVGDPVTVTRHADGLPRAYFPLTTTLDAPGLYTARAELDGEAAEMAFEVKAAADVLVIQPGTAMPALETPTVADARGVNPICTRDPVCALHDVTVAEALTAGQPLALLVATPAFCQITICGPVLDVLIDAAGAHPDVKLLHAEVYKDPAKDVTSAAAFAPVAGALGLHFEPCLVLVGADGTVRERLDVIYDRAEVDAALGRLTVGSTD